MNIRNQEIELQTTLWEVVGFFTKKEVTAPQQVEGLPCHAEITESMIPEDLLFGQEHLLDFSMLKKEKLCLN